MRSLLCRLAGILLAFQVLLPTGANPAHVQLEERYLNPPSQYGMVPFFWLTGEPLSEERIAWELDQLKANGFSGINVNYTHTSLGCSYKGDPALFSPAWWKFWERIVDACAARGMAIGFDDYLVTHGNPELASVGSRILSDSPGAGGLLLRRNGDLVRQGQSVPLGKIISETVIAAAAYRLKEEFQILFLQWTWVPCPGTR